MKRQHTLLALVCGACLLAGCTSTDEGPPTGSIRGSVSLEGEARPEGILVDVETNDRQTRTNSAGDFAFSGLRTGEYVLEISETGYVTRRPTVEIQTDRATQIDVTLEQVNEPPRIDDVSLDPETVEPGEAATVTVTASDPNPDNLTFSFSASGGFTVEEAIGDEATIQAPETFGELGSVTVTVEDPDGRTDRERLAIKTAQNRPPSVNSITATPPTLEPGATGTLDASIADPDGDELNVEWDPPAGWSVASPEAATTEITAPDRAGQDAIIELTVFDEHGAQVESAIGVSTRRNEGPSISSLTATPPTADPGGTMQLNLAVDDPEDGPLNFQWAAPSAWTLSDRFAESPTVTAPDTPGATATIGVTVSDSRGATADASIVVSTRPNRPPVIEDIVPETTRLSRGGSTVVNATATDPEGDSLSYAWSLDESGWTLQGTGAQVEVQAPEIEGRSAVLTLSVTDSRGATANSSISLSTEPNRKPIVSSVFPTSDPIPRGGQTEVQVNASDPNADSLSYAWSIDDAAWSVVGSGATVDVVAPDDPSSSAIVTVDVSDDLGATTSASLLVRTARNDAPSITSVHPSPTPLSAGRGPNATFSYSPTASDPDDPASALTWSLKTNPATSATIDPDNGQISWTTNHTALNSNVVFEVTVSDRVSNASQTFTVPVGDLGLQQSGANWFGEDYPAFGRFDADAKSDFAAAERPGNLLRYVLSGDGYSNDQSVSRPSSGGVASCAFNRAGDLEGDGDADVLTVCNEDGTGAARIKILKWTNTGSGFQPGGVFDTGINSRVRDVRALDLDGDSTTELVASTRADDLLVIENDAAGNLSLAQTVSPPPPSGASGGFAIRRIRVADVDADPELEVVALETYGSGSNTQTRASVYSFDASGNLGAVQDATVVLQQGPRKMNLTDLNGDGTPDIVVKTDADADGDIAIESYLNNGSGQFSRTGSIESSELCNNSTARGIATGDFDDDGLTDVAVGDGCTGRAHIAFGDGTGQFDLFIELDQSPDLLSFPPLFVATGSFDGDGIDDLFISDYFDFSFYY
jgi:predicted secreted protein